MVMGKNKKTRPIFISMKNWSIWKVELTELNLKSWTYWVESRASFPKFFTMYHPQGTNCLIFTWRVLKTNADHASLTCHLCISIIEEKWRQLLWLFVWVNVIIPILLTIDIHLLKWTFDHDASFDSHLPLS